MYMKRLIAVVSLLGCVVVANAQTAGKFAWQDVGRRLKASQAISPLGANFAGEKVSLSNGALSFSAVDVSLPGNDQLPVAFSRSYVVKNRKDYYSEDMLADWSVDVPNISGIFSTDWSVSGTTPGNRCSSTNLPPIPAGGYSLREYWQGVTVDIPGEAGGDMLIANAGINKPSTGGPYPWVTGDGMTHIACLATIKNGSGEGFIATTADGTRYWFDWMAQYTEPALKGNQVNPGSGSPIYAQLARRRNVLLATRVQDRFGNSVDYTYTNSWNQPAKLTKILASDGRQITITYSGGYVSSVSDGSRSWSYGYQNTSGGRKTLVSVTLPDSSAWNIGFSQFTDAEIKYNESPGGEILRNCMSVEPPQNPASEPVGTITHPSGGLGTFTVNIQEHGRSWVPISCSHVTTSPSGAEPGTGNNTNDDLNNWAISDNSFTLKQKQITGPGLATAVWNYSYVAEISVVFRGGGNFEYPVCSSGAACALAPCTSEACAMSSKTIVTGPGGEWTRYSYGNSYLYNEGKLLKVESGTSATNILKQVVNTYDLSTVNQAYPAKFGESLRTSGDGFTSEYHRPLLRTETDQQGVRFKYQVDTFDSFARPTQVTKSSAPIP